MTTAKVVNRGEKVPFDGVLVPGPEFAAEAETIRDLQFEVQNPPPKECESTLLWPGLFTGALLGVVGTLSAVRR